MSKFLMPLIVLLTFADCALRADEAITEDNQEERAHYQKVCKDFGVPFLEEDFEALHKNNFVPEKIPVHGGTANSAHGQEKFINLDDVVNNRVLLEEYAMAYIPGARSAEIDADLATEVIESSPEEIRKIIARIKKGVFRDIEKNVVLFGVPGTGKTTIAKAMGHECDMPCLLFDASKISTTYMNSGEESLKNIFALARSYGRPCIIAIDELEVLIKKHANANGHESAILIALWQEIDKASDSKIVVIVNMNSKKDMPAQMNDRTTEVYIPLPNEQQRCRAFVYHLQQQDELFYFDYEDEIPALARKLAGITHDFSQRDIKSMVIKATADAAIADYEKVVTMQDFKAAIKIIEKDASRKEERAKGTWLYDTKKYCKENALTVVGTGLTVAGLAATIYFYYHRHNFDVNNMKVQAEYNKKNLEYQESSNYYQRAGAWGSFCGAFCGLFGGVAGAIYAGPVGMLVGAMKGCATGAQIGTCGGTGAACLYQISWKDTKQLASTVTYYAKKSFGRK